tara:strand:+ start:259 stop:528 length:270 start_codon:yes stop_codon:yes gene_type:complete
MESKLIQGLYCSTGNQEWKKVRIGLKVETFAKELVRLKDQVSEAGFLNIDICVSKDGQKLYAILDDFKPEKQTQVSSADHSPDRNGLPF